GGPERGDPAPRDPPHAPTHARDRAPLARVRHPLHPEIARARVGRDHPDLHPRGHPGAEGCLRPGQAGLLIGPRSELRVAIEHLDTVVLGAGIAGCALAYHLAGRHVGAVVVYDPRTPAAGATGRAAGVVTEQLWNEWDVEVARASKNEYAQLAARWDPTAFTANGFARFTAH